MGNRGLRSIIVGALVLGILVLTRATELRAQSRVGSDSATRITHLGRSLVYGTITGLAFGAVDQWQNDPPEWGKGWSGYGKRAASNIGEFYIQEGVTEGLAAAMNRPVDYTRCKCRETGSRIWWATQSAVLDVMPDGRRVIAIPRIVGAYAGSFAQAAWRPSGQNGKVGTALINGTESLVLGAAINIFYEFKPHRQPAPLAGDRK